MTDITNVAEFENIKPELIICCGDTITHLDNKREIEKFISDATEILEDNGHLIFTFRDYTNELDNQQRSIPVKSTADRILTCILEYETEKVKVTDLLHENLMENGHKKSALTKK